MFLNLDAGVTRGTVPDFERISKQLRSRLKQERKRAEVFQKQLAALNQAEIDRLIRLTQEQSLDKEQKIAEQDRQPFEAAPAEDIGERNGQEPFSKGSSTELYLDLMKRSLKHAIYDEPQVEGCSLPTAAHTMVGFDGLNKLQSCVEDVLANNVPGDLIETGVWRGGASIFMRAILKAYGVEDRRVWVADSFEGLPPPDPDRYPHDGDFHLFLKACGVDNEELAVSLEQVKSNFERYGLLDGQVRFLKGWFSETLPEAPIERLAVARLDGDMYESTMDALANLYPKLSVGGYLIVDDYAVPACRRAVHDYREAHGIDEEIQPIDRMAVFWQRAE